MNISLSSNGAARMRLAFDQAPAKTTRALLAAMTAAVAALQKEIVDALPAHSGLTRASVGSDAFATPAGVLGVVGSAQPVAMFLELGTRPHMPPVAALEGWVRDRLGVSAADAHRVAFLIARKIARVGTPALKIFEKTLAANKGQIDALFERAVAGLALDLNGGAA